MGDNALQVSLSRIGSAKRFRARFASCTYLLLCSLLPGLTAYRVPRTSAPVARWLWRVLVLVYISATLALNVEQTARL